LFAGEVVGFTDSIGGRNEHSRRIYLLDRPAFDSVWPGVQQTAYAPKQNRDRNKDAKQNMRLVDKFSHEKVCLGLLLCARAVIRVVYY